MESGLLAFGKKRQILFFSLSGYKEAKITHVVWITKRQKKEKGCFFDPSFP
jgi:hypothetical protein